MIQNGTLSFISDPTDLKNLKILKAEAVKKFVEDINAIPKKDLENRNLILSIGTGGTISMKPSPEGFVPDLDFESIFKRVDPELNKNFIVKGFNAFRIDSSQMHLDNIQDLGIFMTYVYKHVRKKFLGFLILHGTDTMAEASTYLAMQMGPNLPFPVVYTGAQKSIQIPINDASLNVKHAVFALESMEKENACEVTIVFGDAILLAVGAKKISDESRNAFEAYMHELLADLSTLKYPIIFQKWIRTSNTTSAFRPKIFNGYSHILDVDSKLSMNPLQLARQIEDDNVRAVLLSTYGAGTADINIINTISEATKKKGIPAFAVSPVDSDPSLGGYVSGKEMQKKGIHSLYMTENAARAKFEIATRSFVHTEDIIEFMQTPYIGETPTEITRRRSALLRS